MASADFADVVDASLNVLRKSLLEAYSEANHRHSVESLPRRLEADLQEVKSEFRSSAGVASFNSSQFSQGRISFKQQGADKDSDPESDEEHHSNDSPEARRMLSDPSEVAVDMKGQEQDKALRKAMQQRLQVRLNVLSATQLVSGRNLHDAVGALGLTTYTIEDMNTLVKALAKYIDLKLVKKEAPKQLLRSQTSNSIFSAQGPDFMRALWHWPTVADKSDKPRPTASRSTENSLTTPTKSFESEKSEENLALTVVPAKALMELFITKDVELPKQVFRQQTVLNQFQAMREILVAGDTNRLVAELTFVRINDLAAPPEALDPLFYIEPVVAVLIVVNGIMIGFQTDRAFESWPGWPYIETVFAVLLVLECIVRFWLSGSKQFFCGPDFHWNLFDMFLVLTAVTDVVFQLAFPEQKADMAGASLLRFCRLIRLVRVVKVFRLNYMKELRLMVKGLVGGIRTLLLSFALLFAVLYVISGFATMTLGRDDRTEELGLQTHFENIPKSMFTAFRCFSGECFADSGVPIASVLSTNLGWGFVLCYVLSYMLVSMGIFNVILAVYVDITMRAAKETEISTAEQYARESIRIARTTRELLKKFAEAHRVFYDRERDDGAREQMKSLLLSTSDFLDDAHIDDIAITKELFLLVIQDQRVQQLMNDLDLPADRANLFEVIDADGSGTLHVTELVQGLLKIRGDLTKSDTVAVLLTAKSVHTMVAELKAEQQNFRGMLLELFATQDALRKSLNKSGKSTRGANPKVNFMRRTAEQPERKLPRSESGMSARSPPSPPSPPDFNHTKCRTVECLVTLPADELLSAYVAIPHGRCCEDMMAAPGIPWAPTIDGVELPDHPLQLLKQQRVNHVPTVTGITLDDGSRFFEQYNLSFTDFVTLFEDQYESSRGQAELYRSESHVSLPGYSDGWWSAERAVTDQNFFCPSHFAWRSLAVTGSPVFGYLFASSSDSPIVHHSSELPFLFMNLTENASLEEWQLAEEVAMSWYRFADVGHPGGHGDRWPVWPQSGEAPILKFQVASKGGTQVIDGNQRDRQCTFMMEWINRTLRDGSVAFRGSVNISSLPKREEQEHIMVV